MATAIRRFASEVDAIVVRASGEAPISLRICVLILCGMAEFTTFLDRSTAFVFEDSNVLPWKGPFTFTPKLSYLIWGALHLTDPWQYHALNLGVHALTSVMVGLVAAKLWPAWYRFDYIGDGHYGNGWHISRPTNGLAWACGSIFWLHPLAIPAVGYAAALPEMLVCLGAVSLTWALLHGWKWRWICLAGSILLLTLNVKQSAVGVLLLPAVVLIVRPIRWRGYAGWFWAFGFLAFLAGVTVAQSVDFVRTSYPWHRWPEEMLPMAAQAWVLAAQSILPIRIAFQLDPQPEWLGILSWIAGWSITAGLVVFCLGMRWRVTAFAILYVLALITVRLIVPASNWQDRAPEMWYTQQWYPALPGMVWLLVSFVAGDASRAEPSGE